MKIRAARPALSSILGSSRSIKKESHSSKKTNENSEIEILNDPDSAKERIAVEEALQRLELRKVSGTANTEEDKSTENNENEDDNKLVQGTCPFRFVPLRLSGRTHKPSRASAALLDEIGGLEGLRAMTERFYKKAFADATLDKFIRSHKDPHGQRFATWIHEKLGGPGYLWSEDRASRPNESVRIAGGQRMVVHDRTSAHVAAWYSAKRPSTEVGRHFQLDECRVWMRLHFWAMREAGLPEISPSFCDFYVRFIAHFVRVYEGKAPAFARESLRWSQDPKNIERYISNQRTMTDVLGLSYRKQLQQIPRSEAEDYEWPYFE